MIALLWFLLTLFASPLKSKSRLEAENAALRYQLIVLRRKVRGRIQPTNCDRLVFIQLYRWFPGIGLDFVGTGVGSRARLEGGRRLTRSCGRQEGAPSLTWRSTPLWGAPRIHGELLKLGFEVAQSSVAKYMVKRAMADFKTRWLASIN
jgi:hypothetical protein